MITFADIVNTPASPVAGYNQLVKRLHGEAGTFAPRPTLTEVRDRIVANAIAAADYSRGLYAGQRGVVVAGDYSEAYVRGWVEGACC
jgi:hypothetical protein